MYQLLQRTYRGYATHPNVAAALLLEHGCEKVPNDAMRRQFESAALSLDRFGWASVQLDGGIEKSLAKVADWFAKRLAAQPPPERTSANPGALSVGLMSAPRPAGRRRQHLRLSPAPSLPRAARCCCRRVIRCWPLPPFAPPCSAPDRPARLSLTASRARSRACTSSPPRPTIGSRTSRDSAAVASTSLSHLCPGTRDKGIAAARAAIRRSGGTRPAAGR